MPTYDLVSFGQMIIIIVRFKTKLQLEKKRIM